LIETEKRKMEYGKRVSIRDSQKSLIQGRVSGLQMERETGRRPPSLKTILEERERGSSSPLETSTLNGMQQPSIMSVMKKN